MNCKTEDKSCQCFPRNGEQLCKLMNLNCEQLSKRVQLDQQDVYCYIVNSLERTVDGIITQKGSGPNIEGDMITLCTCKHWMRTFKPVEQWVGVWIAGFTNVKAGAGKNMLFYLMKVGLAFESHYDMWNSDKIADVTKQEKAAHRNPLGDMFKPKSKVRVPVDIFKYKSYQEPKKHSHLKGGEWHRDIDYKGVAARRAVLLVGDKVNSFLWREPNLSFRGQLYRGQKKFTISELLNEYLRPSSKL